MELVLGLIIAAASIVGFVVLLLKGYAWGASVFAALMVLGYAILITWRFWVLRGTVISAASELRTDDVPRTVQELAIGLRIELERLHRIMGVHSTEERLGTAQVLAEVLERVVGLAYRLLSAQSVELALFDQAAGMYHSALVIGQPLRSGGQAMLDDSSGAAPKRLDPHVLIQPLEFAGTTLGSLRLCGAQGRIFTSSDRECFKLLSLQASLAVLNSEFTRELKRMQRAAEESVRAKTGFLANLSHELRGPLGVMLNAVELVSDGLCGAVNDDQIHTLELAKKSGSHLLDLVNDVLDYAKIEAGKLKPQPADVALSELLPDLSNVMRTAADAKKHKLVTKPVEERLGVVCDRRHLRQILINLLSNAVKYTPPEGRIEFGAERAPGGRVRIYVKDSGVGISRENREKVFSAFERISTGYASEQAGTGLGMPLSRRMAELNGGTLDFESEEGKGSTFWVMLVATELAGDETPGETQRGQVRRGKGRGETLILCDKNIEERRMAAKYLQESGFQVIQVESTKAVRQLVNDSDIAAVVLDNSVLDHGGNQIIQELRATGRGYVPLVVLTSRAFEFDLEDYLRQGADRCVAKPISLAELSAAVEDVVAIKKRPGAP